MVSSISKYCIRLLKFWSSNGSDVFTEGAAVGNEVSVVALKLDGSSVMEIAGGEVVAIILGTADGESVGPAVGEF